MSFKEYIFETFALGTDLGDGFAAWLVVGLRWRQRDHFWFVQLLWDAKIVRFDQFGRFWGDLRHPALVHKSWGAEMVTLVAVHSTLHYQLFICVSRILQSIWCQSLVWHSNVDRKLSRRGAGLLKRTDHRSGNGFLILRSRLGGRASDTAPVLESRRLENLEFCFKSVGFLS